MSAVLLARKLNFKKDKIRTRRNARAHIVTPVGPGMQYSHQASATKTMTHIAHGPHGNTKTVHHSYSREPHDVACSHGMVPRVLSAGMPRE